jgi:hypothetical protein
LLYGLFYPFLQILIVEGITHSCSEEYSRDYNNYRDFPEKPEELNLGDWLTLNVALRADSKKANQIPNTIKIYLSNFLVVLILGIVT